MRDSFLPFALPSIGEEEIEEVVDTLKSGWVTTGPKTKLFEERFREYINSQQAIAVNSCTAGLHIALTALGVGPGDEVILPTLTFCSTANVVVHLRARPVLVDVAEDFNVNPAAIEKAITPKTRAIIPVHYGGQACDLEAIYRIAAEHNLAIVEDAAHAVGATYCGHKIGSDSLISFLKEKTGFHAKSITAFSFYATKNMTTGEGGMITTADPELAERMRLFTLHGMNRDAWKRYTSTGSWYYEVVAAGYKDNMTDIQAALGIHQLKKLEGFIKSRQAYARIYDERLAGLPEVETPVTHPEREHIYHLYVIRLKLNSLTVDRAKFVEELKNKNIGASVHFIPVHLHPYYRDSYGYKRGDFPCAEGLYEQIISLALYPDMKEEDVHDVVLAIQQIIENQRR